MPQPMPHDAIGHQDPLKANLAHLLDRLSEVKPDYRRSLDNEATKTPDEEKLSFIKEILGRETAAYVIQVHPKTFDRYLAKKDQPSKHSTQSLIREVFKVLRIIVDEYDATAAKAWLLGTNSLLNEESPAEVFHRATPEVNLDMCKLIIIAALAFIEE
jgi:hypothetical protein